MQHIFYREEFPLIFLSVLLACIFSVLIAAYFFYSNRQLACRMPKQDLSPIYTQKVTYFSTTIRIAGKNVPVMLEDRNTGTLILHVPPDTTLDLWYYSIKVANDYQEEGDLLAWKEGI